MLKSVLTFFINCLIFIHMDVCICVEVKGQLVGDIPLLMPCESRDRSVFRLDNKHPYTPEAISAGIFLMVHYI